VKALTPRQATLWLLGGTVFWGSSFPLMSIATNGLATVSGVPAHDLAGQALVGATINGWRYGAAAILMALLLLPQWRRTTRVEILGGTVLGSFVGMGMFLQIVGLAWVVPSISGMLTATPVILAPLAQWLLLRRPVPRQVWWAALIAGVGCLVLTLGGDTAQVATSLIGPPPFPYAGECLTFLGALCFTGHIISVDTFGSRCDPGRLTGLLFIMVALVNGLIAWVVSGDRVAMMTHLPALLPQPSWLGAMAGLIVFSSIIALWIMNRAQPSITPARAAVLYTLEPVFALLFSLLLGQEGLTRWTLVGSALVIGGALWSIPRRARETR